MARVPRDTASDPPAASKKSSPADVDLDELNRRIADEAAAATTADKLNPK